MYLRKYMYIYIREYMYTHTHIYKALRGPRVWANKSMQIQNPKHNDEILKERQFVLVCVFA